ncbi:5-dehydro-4-deoxy-D-glucuronate isomerase [Paracoccaceae bacterium Fryx2]|nr:5-dehydro-4-deoxy-D-glucuronate isomerase [Paracoccaceae bacterium Fryx2]
MLDVEIRHAIDPETARGLDTDGLRRHFHLGGMFVGGEIRLCYTHYDRMIIGGAVPDADPMVLDHVPQCGTASILDRREMAIVNIGGPGTVSAGKTYRLERADVLYLPMGSGPVTFGGKGRFYILSAPAHRACPARLIRIGEAKRVQMGAAETSNLRTMCQFIHPDVMESCQLAVGYTQLAPGSVCNTMPAHLHDRRMETYLYLDLAHDACVFHFMGRPDETRHLVMRNEEAAVSPPWSIHCGAGTGAYSFVWATAGDNADNRDVEMVAVCAMR